MSFAIDPITPVTIPIAGVEAVFPVNNIYCVGRNYADHAIEMGGDPNREAPFFFMKPAYAVSTNGVAVSYPSHSMDVHHELEMVVALANGGVDISVDKAMGLVYGYSIGVDMTRRDLQAEAKDKRRPWEAGKSFAQAAPLADLLPISETGEINAAEIQLVINGEVRQQGNVNQMIWKVTEIISRLSEVFLLQAGDLIFTGTPAGVGPVEIGDEVTATLTGLPELNFKVV